MDNFNMKRWLTENRVGLYSKVKEDRIPSIKVLRDLYYFDRLSTLAAKEDVDPKHHPYASLWAKAGDILNADSEEFDMVLSSGRLEKGVDYTDESLQEIDPATLGMGQEEADDEMLARGGQKGDWVDNASMDVMAERRGTRVNSLELKEFQPIILGKEYIMDLEVDFEYHTEEADYVDHMMTSPGGLYVDDVKVTAVKNLAVDEGGDDYRDINDPAAINQIKDLLNTDPKLKKQVEREVAESDALEKFDADSDYDDDRYERDMEETVGYVMKTKKADPEQEF
jgi:hypothetical protein